MTAFKLFAPYALLFLLIVVLVVLAARTMTPLEVAR